MYAVFIPADITAPVEGRDWPEKSEHRQLEFMQELVGGYIEVLGELRFTPAEIGRRVIMVINEEGKLKGLPGNARATALYRYGHVDVVVGDAFLCEDNAPDMRGFSQSRALELVHYVQGLGEPRVLGGWGKP